jgi:hypothetical protein
VSLPREGPASGSLAILLISEESSHQAHADGLPRTTALGHNQPRHHARNTPAEVKARVGPRVAAHLSFARQKHVSVCAQSPTRSSAPRRRSNERRPVSMGGGLTCDAGGGGEVGLGA